SACFWGHWPWRGWPRRTHGRRTGPTWRWQITAPRRPPPRPGRRRNRPGPSVDPAVYVCTANQVWDPEETAGSTLIEARVQHYFIDLFVPALLGFGMPPYTAWRR